MWRLGAPSGHLLHPVEQLLWFFGFSLFKQVYELIEGVSWLALLFGVSDEDSKSNHFSLEGLSVLLEHHWLLLHQILFDLLTELPWLRSGLSDLHLFLVRLALSRVSFAHVTPHELIWSRTFWGKSYIWSPSVNLRPYSPQLALLHSRRHHLKRST